MEMANAAGAAPKVSSGKVYMLTLKAATAKMLSEIPAAAHPGEVAHGRAAVARETTPAARHTRKRAARAAPPRSAKRRERQAPRKPPPAPKTGGKPVAREPTPAARHTRKRAAGAARPRSTNRRESQPPRKPPQHANTGGIQTYQAACWSVRRYTSTMYFEVQKNQKK